MKMKWNIKKYPSSCRQVLSKLFEAARSRVPLAGLIPVPRPRLASNNNVKKKN